MESVEVKSETKPLTVEELNIDILPTIYEIIRSVERDPHENAAKARESQDCSQKVLELQKKLDQARSQVRYLAGIEYNKEQQLQRLEALRTQLRLKQDLLLKYRHIYLANNERLVQKLSESYPIRRSAQLLVSLFLRSKNAIKDSGVGKDLNNNRLKSFAQRFKDNLKEEVENVKRDLKNKPK